MFATDLNANSYEGIVNGDQASLDDYLARVARKMFNVVVQEDGTTRLQHLPF